MGTLALRIISYRKSTKPLFENCICPVFVLALATLFTVLGLAGMELTFFVAAL